ncbi:MAG: AraC family transcriptional regulator, partial [Clostridia bacterium]|nr:AraC family transcriptional regulator [Clostridia bacterium]
KKMLWDSANSIGYIAESCGFGCQQYLNKIFKQQTGMTPGQYRKSIGENYLL